MARGPSAAEVIALYRDVPFEEVPLDGMRKTIATRLVQAKQTIPHFYLTADVDIGRLLALREDANAAAPKGKDGAPAYRLSVNDLVIKMWAVALQRVPAANAVWAEDRILRFKHSDIGIAVAIEGGLITPVIRQAEPKTLTAISAEMRELAERARARKLKPNEYQGGSSAISNLGMYGVREFSAIINPPHATILAVGASRRQAVEKDDGSGRLRQHDDGDAVVRPPRGRWRARRRAAGGVQGICRAAGDDAGLDSMLMIASTRTTDMADERSRSCCPGRRSRRSSTGWRRSRCTGSPTPRIATRCSRRSARACAPWPSSVSSDKIGADLMAKLPKLEIVSTFGVGYDHVDVKWAAEHGITVTNTPKVLNEEVADTALGLILLHGARVPAGGALPARRQMGRARLSAHQGDAARPHRRHGRHGRASARRSRGGSTR